MNDYRWLRLLNREFNRSRIDSLDDLGRYAAIDTATVEDIMDGSALPSRSEVQHLAYAVTADIHLRNLILTEYDTEVGYVTARPPTDMQLLTEAIDNLTRAIERTGISIPARRRVRRQFVARWGSNRIRR